MTLKTVFAALLLALPVCSFAGAVPLDAPLLVVGHMNPDTDSICSAIAVAALKTAQGIPAQAIAQSPINAETRYVLDTFKLTYPPVISKVAGRKVFLVDHSDYAQAPADLKEAELIGFADHHKLGGLKSGKPVEVWAAPLGAATTVIARMYDTAGIDIPKDVAGCMLSAILSDTVRFKSATTTPEDKKTATRLARLAEVTDIDALGAQIFEAKSDIRGKSPATLLQSDLKTFDMNGHKVAISQLEFQDLTPIRSLKESLLTAMQALKRDGYHSVFLMLTDVSQGATELLFISDSKNIAEAAWGIKSEGHSVWLPGVMSRKGQIVAPLEKAFSGRGL